MPPTSAYAVGRTSAAVRRAWFQVETNASMERSNNVAHTSNFASRNSAVGMQGAWGNLFVGQWTTPWADLDALWCDRYGRPPMAR